MDIEVIEKSKCCGCTACYSVCPKKAISMKMDEQGFEYPVINEQNCIKCGLCSAVCEFLPEMKKSTSVAYAAKNIDKEIVLKSSSGGVSDALCKSIITKGGVVYGAIFDEKFEVRYSRASTYEECRAFLGSKYVQAKLNNTFEQIFDDLKKNISVLFVGTSCYVYGLLRFLEKKNCCTDRLTTVDFICHGVPSPGLFEDYIKFINKGSGLKKISFRNKFDKKSEPLKLPWKFGKYNCSLEFNNGKKEINTLKSRIFLNLFTSNNCLRQNCYNCNFIGDSKPSDITIADFWGIEEANPSFHDSFGVSAIMVRSQKGKHLLENCEYIEKAETTVEKISKKQGMMHFSSTKGENYESFWELYKKYGFEKVAKQYGEYNLAGWLRNTKLYEIWAKIRYGQE